MPLGESAGRGLGKSWAVLFVLCGLLFPSGCRPGADTATTELQQGRNAYAGCAAQTFRLERGEAVWGATPAAATAGSSLSVTADRRSGGWLRFEVLKDVPVTSAELSLYCTESDANFPQVISLAVMLDVPPGIGGRTPLVEGKTYYSGEGWRFDVKDLRAFREVRLNGTGWYRFDVTEWVRDWSHRPERNEGMLLVNFWRSPGGGFKGCAFAGPEYPDPALRPKLTIVSRPGGAALKASLSAETSPAAAEAAPPPHFGDILSVAGSSDGPPPRLVTQVATGPGAFEASAVVLEKFPSGFATGPQEFKVLDGRALLPATATGRYVVRAELRNPQGQVTDSEELSAKVYLVRPHPRLFVTREVLKELKEMAAGPNAKRWNDFVAAAEEAKGEDSEAGLALSYLVTGNKTHVEKAVTMMRQLAQEVIDKAEKAGGTLPKDTGSEVLPRSRGPRISVLFDWCYPELSAEDKALGIKALNLLYDYNRRVVTSPNLFREGTVYHNYGVWAFWAQSFTGLATFGDNPRAVEQMDDVRFARFEGEILPMLNRLDGGYWHEGMRYSGIRRLILEWMLAWKSGTGEDLAGCTNHNDEIIRWYIYATDPTETYVRASENNSYGQQAVDRNHWQLMLYACELVRDGKSVPCGRKWLAEHRPPVVETWREILFFRPEKTTRDWRGDWPLSYLSKGMSVVFLRSGWRPDDTWASFQCGPFVHDYQGLNQGHFNLHRQADLAVDSFLYGVKRDARRAPAYNTILLDGWGPQEGAFAEDPYWNHWRKGLQDHGRIVTFEDRGEFAYALGEFSGAFSEYREIPERTLLAAKSRAEIATREFLFLRPRTFVVLDKIRSRADSKKQWLLNVTQPPDIVSNVYRVKNGDAQMLVQTLLPADGFTASYENLADFLYEKGKQVMNANICRLTVSTTVPGKDAVFLHLIVLGSEPEGLSPRLQHEGQSYRLTFDMDGRTYGMEFPDAMDKAGGNIRITEQDGKRLESPLGGKR